jgi:hypothetical protein
MKNKRYIVIKNNKIIGEGDTHPDIYKLIGCHKQQFNTIFILTIFETSIIFKKDNYKVIDKLNC